MDTNQLEFFKKLLDNKKRDCIDTINNLLQRVTDDRENGLDHQSFPSTYDSVEFNSLSLTNYAQIEREKQHLMRIISALKRINDGTFGICRTCNNPINEERLKVVPTTTSCIACKNAETTPIYRLINNRPRVRVTKLQ